MVATKVEHLDLLERKELGKAARERADRAAHEGWERPAGGPDPVALLEEQNKTREPDLISVRHGRMKVSPFTFYRGAARIMAEDLRETPTAELDVQLCGDAHLSNFGVFASPERRLLFDVNDFDETLPGPFEFDVKRLAASFAIAARNNGFPPAGVRTATMHAVASYREAMRSFSTMPNMGVWYASLSEDQLKEFIKRAATSSDRRMTKQAAKALDKARTKDSVQALEKLGEVVDGKYRIASQAPLIIPARDLAKTYGITPEQIQESIHDQFRRYRATLQDDRRHLLERYEIVDMARKVVGVGSVGTRAFIVLLQGRNERDPLFLQVKEATASVLERALPKSKYRQPGERVVQGQRLMQAASDMLLGWTKGVEADRYFYWRQLRDMKGSADVEAMDARALAFYAGVCGWTLARAHARSGDSVAISAYLGKSDAFDRAITDFAERYAAQNDRDYEAFSEAIANGTLDAVEGV